MSKLCFRPRGGQEGINPSKIEMETLSRVMSAKYADEYIPLPNLTLPEQVKILKSETKCTHKDVEYWETNSGGHGWCCSKCGTVVQWG